MFRKPSSTAPSTAPTGSKEGTSHPFTEFSLRWESLIGLHGFQAATTKRNSR